MTNKTIEAVTVERDEFGWWTHPVYEEAFADRECVPVAEFDEWMNSHGLQWSIDSIEYTDDLNAANEYMMHGSCAKWEPVKPEGDGWFVGSIHETEDGAVCIWLRHKGAGNDE